MLWPNLSTDVNDIMLSVLRKQHTLIAHLTQIASFGGCLYAAHEQGDSTTAVVAAKQWSLVARVPGLLNTQKCTICSHKRLLAYSVRLNGTGMAAEFSQQHALGQSSSAAYEETLFSTGWQVPWRSCNPGAPAVPWETVQELLLMARDALVAKQRAAEVNVRCG
jgi:hypothetical protein